MAKVSKDIPLVEITLRKYEKPSEDNSKRDIIRKLCLSVGLLQPGDSRDIIVDILHVLLENNEMTSEEITNKVIEYRKKSKLPLVGVASSNIRRQLKRLRDMYFVEKIKNNYRIAENETLEYLFKEKIEKFILPSIIDRVRDYLKLLK